jgi:hypothetical protein
VGSGAAGAWTAATHTGGVDSGSLTQTDAWAMCASEPAAPPPLPSAAPANLAPPSIAGTARAGTLLSVVAGRWSGSPSLTYEWLRCDTVCVPVGTGPRYRPTRADAGSRLRVRETAGAISAVSTTTGWVQGRPTTAEIKTELGRRLAPRGKPGHIDTLLASGGVTLDVGQRGADDPLARGSTSGTRQRRERRRRHAQHERATRQVRRPDQSSTGSPIGTQRKRSLTTTGAWLSARSIPPRPSLKCDQPS